MGITALLSCIAFHYTQADTLPNVTYLVAADKLFLGAYVFVAATLVLSIAAFRLHERRPRLAHTADRAGLWLLPGISAVGLVVLLSTSLTQPAHASVPLADRPSFPVLRVAVATLEGQVPEQRAALVVRGADGAFRPMLAAEAPAMTNALVRLLPDGGMRLLWRLREDAKWSDGAPITSEDLEFSITQLKEPLRVKVERLDAAPQKLDGASVKIDVITSIR
jgi:ABC-type transport system substrate-binding protein